MSGRSFAKRRSASTVCLVGLSNSFINVVSMQSGYASGVPGSGTRRYNV